MRTHSFMLGLAMVAGAAGAQAGQMIAVDSSRALFSVNIATGAKTGIGTVSANAGTTGGLAYDRAAGRLWVTSTSNDAVYLLDVNTGTATQIGAGYGDSAVVMHGLEWDNSTGTLYGVSSHNNGLYTINTSTGVATLVGTSGLSSFTNLGYNLDTNVMYATNSGTDSFYRINLGTGAVTLIGALGTSTNPNGLAYNFDNGIMYMIDNSTDNFYSINLNTGAATVIGPMGSGNLLGLAYIPSPGTATLLGLAGLAAARRRR